MIRRRLLVAVMAVVTAVMVVAGLLVVAALRDRQIDDVDRQVHRTDRRVDRYIEALATYNLSPPPFGSLDIRPPYVDRATAFVNLDPTGSVEGHSPATATSDPIRCRTPASFHRPVRSRPWVRLVATVPTTGCSASPSTTVGRL